ncbi:MAG: GntR family transcriptional regulator [Bacillota bacterium]|jgi:DNA-binding GntR family transcriptional regulator|nr:GntR family transcriptional regulator [Bacillota bacterium]HHT90664.1 GntR family transcriptional regulator [Bacillota bacterium]
MLDTIEVYYHGSVSLGAIPILDLARPHGKGRRSAREYLYQTLRAKILCLELKPGTKMPEQEVSDEFQVSRTPVREVFVQLLQDELVEIYPQRGTYVSLINLKHLEEGRFVRELVEKVVIREAAGRLSKDDLFELETNLASQKISYRERNYLQMLALDDAFHGAIFRACGRGRSWAMVQKLGYDFIRVRVLRLSHDFHWDKILWQHQLIFKALKDGDSQEAARIMGEHLQMVIVEKEQLTEEYPEYFAELKGAGLR